MDRDTLKVHIDNPYDCIESQHDVEEHYQFLYETLRAQESCAEQLEEELQSGRNLAGSFATYVAQRYNAFRCQLIDANQLANDYRKELANRKRYRQEISGLRSSILEATAARHKDQEKFQLQLIKVQN